MDGSAHLCNDEWGGNKPYPKPCGSWWTAIEESIKEIDGWPDRFAVNCLRRWADDKTYKANERKAERNRYELGP